MYLCSMFLQHLHYVIMSSLCCHMEWSHEAIESTGEKQIIKPLFNFLTSIVTYLKSKTSNPPPQTLLLEISHFEPFSEQEFFSSAVPTFLNKVPNYRLKASLSWVINTVLVTSLQTLLLHVSKATCDLHLLWMDLKMITVFVRKESR